MEFFNLHKGLHKVLLGPSEKLRMARPEGSAIPKDEDKGYLCTDCGASITITGSLAKTTDVVERKVMIDMAKNGTAMYSSHSCMKLHFVKIELDKRFLLQRQHGTSRRRTKIS